MPDVLDARAVRGWCRAAADGLRRARADIDALNVFPVADSDTGTNLHLTMEAVAEAAEAPSREAELAELWRAVARGALLGARGNSGVIVSQVWRGLAEVLPGAAPCRGRALGEGLRHAASLAFAAVGRPVEGTVLTVARAAGDAAAGKGTDDLAAVARAAADGARGALDRTTGQLDALARAGVVDAGGAGLCVILDSLVGVVSGQRSRVTVPGSGARAMSGPAPARWAPAPVGGSSYEVMYLLDADDDEIPQLRTRLGELGESLVVVGGERLWNIHVHVEDAGAAVEAGLAAGRPHRIRVTHLHPGGDAHAHGRGVVAAVAGEGLAALLEEAGAVVLRQDPASGLSTATVLEAIRRAGEEVVLLPNDASAHEVAHAVAAQAREEGHHVAVVPTKAAVQGLSALAVHDPRRRFADDVIAMTAAAGATRFGEVCLSSETAVTSAGICQPGDALGLVEGDVVVIGSDVREVATEVVDRMLAGGGELVTLVTGEGVKRELGDAVRGHLHRSRPDVDSAVYAGGRPGCSLLIGVE